jgi:hypothetical protein
MKTSVVHIRNAHDIYIGRPKSGGEWRFGNPFIVGRDGVRGECVLKFEHWLATGDSQGCKDASESRRQWILTNIPSLRGKRLGCFCSPASCHGDVLARLADQ